MEKSPKAGLAVILLACGGLVLASGGRLFLLAAEPPVGASAAKDATLPTGTVVERLREGTVISDQDGYFKLTGDRLTFYFSDERRFGCLENLNLERVAKVVGENPDALQWIVSGTITEFQGSNYLLISRAVLRSKSQRRGAASG